MGGGIIVGREEGVDGFRSVDEIGARVENGESPQLSFIMVSKRSKGSEKGTNPAILVYILLFQGGLNITVPS